MTEIKFKRLSDDATIPTRAHKTDSGFDLYAAEDTIIEPDETKVIPTDIAVQLPEDMEGQVRPKSGITSKTKLRVQLGTVDNEYRGEVGVIVDNIETLSDKRKSPFQYYTKTNGEKMYNSLYDGKKHYIFKGTHLIYKGDKIAQLVVQYLPQVEPVEVIGFTDTERGGNGFGSTGV